MVFCSFTPAGALTAKSYAFRARPWELETVDGYDFHDSFGAPLRLDLRGREVVRILPRDGQIVGGWLADRTRFSYDGFRRQRLTIPLGRDVRAVWPAPLLGIRWAGPLWISGVLHPIDWWGAMGRLLAPLPPLFLLGGESSLDTALAVRRFYVKSACFWYNRMRRMELAGAFLGRGDSRTSYLHAIAPLGRADLVLVAGFVPRLESPLLALRIRARARAGVPVLLFGSSSALAAFPHRFLGSSPVALAALVEGRSPLSPVFALAGDPLLLLAPALADRFSPVTLLPLLDRIRRPLTLAIHHSSSAAIHRREVALPPPPVRLWEHWDATLLPLLWLVEEDGLAWDRPNMSQVVYQGHHGDRSAALADLVLPAPAPFEATATRLTFAGEPVVDSAPLAGPPAARLPAEVIWALVLLRRYGTRPPRSVPTAPLPAPLPLPQLPVVPCRLPRFPLPALLPHPLLASAVGRASPTLALAARRLAPSSPFLS